MQFNSYHFFAYYMLGVLLVLSHLLFIKPLQGTWWYPNFIHEETEITQNCDIIVIMELGFKYRSL